MRTRLFASDNASGICPEAWASLAEANRDHAPGYGDDPWTARAEAAVRAFLGRECEVLFLFTGTAANALALSALCPPHGLVACSLPAHVAHDECGAPGFFGGGLQLRPLPGPAGKVDPEALDAFGARADVHAGLPAAVTLTQSTELGTVYGLEELRALGEVARRRRLRLHLDGARLANALAALGCRPAELLEASGAAALSLGGTKNGLPGTEALCVFDPALAEALRYRRKQAGQLASKHRLLAAPWVGALESGAYLHNAQNANARAAELEAGLRALGLSALHPRQANALFVRLPDAAAERLRARGWVFYRDDAWGGDRFVCSWDSRAEDVAELLSDLRACL